MILTTIDTPTFKRLHTSSTSPLDLNIPISTSLSITVNQETEPLTLYFHSGENVDCSLVGCFTVQL